jgi:predicted TIM-barrel fold metal-dependent hydrolase
MVDAHTLFGFWPSRRADLSAEALVRTLRQHGIDRALTLSTHGIFADYAGGNDETLELCGRSNGLLEPVGTVDPRRYPHVLREIKTRADQGVRAWRLFPELQDWAWDSRPVDGILRALKDAGAVLLLDASRPGDPTRVAARTSELALPTVLLGVSGRLMGELLAVLNEARHILVETRRLADPEVVVALARQFGADRLVFGTASPLQYVSSARLPLETAPLSDEERALILGGTISRLLEGS